jgi:hypothetical protein
MIAPMDLTVAAWQTLNPGLKWFFLRPGDL